MYLPPNVSEIRDPYLDLGLNGKNECGIAFLIAQLARDEKQKEHLTRSLVTRYSD